MVKLVEKGFEVHLAIPNNIFISWKKESNPNISRQLYQLEAPPLASFNKSNKLALMPPKNDNNFGNEYKLFSSKIHNKKEKNYRPIEDYQQSDIGISNIGMSNMGLSSNDNYNVDDINLFHSKLDELLA